MLLRRAGAKSDCFPLAPVDPAILNMAPDAPEGDRPDDLWDRAKPSGMPEVQKAAKSILFDLNCKEGDPRRYRRFARLARAFFDGRKRSVAVYASFWSTVAAWLNSWSLGPKTWISVAGAFCDALRDAEVAVVPLVADGSVPDHTLVDAIPLPHRPGSRSGTRAERRLFLWKGEAGRSLPLPSALRDAGRAVTAFEFPDQRLTDPNVLGASNLTRWEMLAELRQLPITLEHRAPTPLAPDPEEAASRQRDLIQFAAVLFQTRLGQQDGAPSSRLDDFGPAWRALSTGRADQELLAGRALATLFLPTVGGAWEPARQLTMDRVDRAGLGPLHDGVDVDAFLAFLGVTPQGSPVPLRLVEDGEHGVVEPVLTPPSLCAAGPAPKGLPPLRLVPRPGSGAHDGGAWWRSILSTWPSLLGPLVEEERAVRARSGIVRTDLLPALSEEPWFPVGGTRGAVPPCFASETPVVAPADLVLRRGDGGDSRYVPLVWSVAGGEDGHILEALGALRGLSRADLRSAGPRPARRLLRQLATIEPSRIEKRLDLVELFQLLIETLAATVEAGQDTGEPIPLLAMEGTTEDRALWERHLRWIGDDADPAWIPADQGVRELLRRYFPHVPLTACLLKPGTLQKWPWLARRALWVEAVVEDDGRRTPQSDELEELVRARLSEALPSLLALAEVSREYVASHSEAREGWAELRAGIQHAGSAWVRYQLHAEGLAEPPLRPGKDRLGEVVYVSGGPARVLFDTASDSADPPRLSDFASPVAEVVARNRAHGPTFRNALAAFEARHLDRLLDEDGARPLVPAWEEAFRPLSLDEQAGLRSRLAAALAAHGIAMLDPLLPILRLRRLGPDDLVPPATGWGTTTEAHLKEILASAGWTDAEERFRPGFACRELHREQWSRWLTPDRRRALAVARERLLLAPGAQEDTPSTESADDDLQGKVERDLDLVGFVPVEAAFSWLFRDVAKPDGLVPTALDHYLLDVVPRYRPVAAPPEPASRLGWTLRPVAGDAPVSRELAPETNEHRAARSEARGAIGLQAEQVVLAWVTSQTDLILRAILRPDDLEAAWATLLAAVPARGRARRAVETAKERWPDDSMALAKALHVSQVWGSAGFDVLGLEAREDGQVVAARYEVKGLPAEDGPVQVHLSHNELATFRSIRCGAPAALKARYQGIWRLIGVEPERRAPHGRLVDLTERLEPFAPRDGGVLRDLWKEGATAGEIVIEVLRPAT